MELTSFAVVIVQFTTLAYCDFYSFVNLQHETIHIGPVSSLIQWIPFEDIASQFIENDLENSPGL
jgi:hypothetical protein